MSEVEARRLAAMLTDRQRRDFLLLAQVIRDIGEVPPRSEYLR